MPIPNCGSPFALLHAMMVRNAHLIVGSPEMGWKQTTFGGSVAVMVLARRAMSFMVAQQSPAAATLGLRRAMFATAPRVREYTRPMMRCPNFQFSTSRLPILLLLLLLVYAGSVRIARAEVDHAKKSSARHVA